MTADIREALDETVNTQVRPFITPLQEETLFALLLGEALAALVRQAGVLAP